MHPLTIRVGLATPSSRIAIGMEQRDIPVLVSANSLFDHARRCFKQAPLQLTDLDVALDSAGFVALARYGRFPWSVRQYVEFALLSGFTWWSQMDCCCEPEIAKNRDQVIQRVNATAQLLSLCRAEYFTALNETPWIAPFSTPPMPILQGWHPDDYAHSAFLAHQALDGEWPEMIGVGSMCRRSLHGPHGLWRVLERLDDVLPRGVKLHLFGVKGTALRHMHHYPRVVSADSMAFEFRARVIAREARISKSVEFRLGVLDEWLARNRSLRDTSQLSLSFQSA